MIKQEKQVPGEIVTPLNTTLKTIKKYNKLYVIRPKFDWIGIRLNKNSPYGGLRA